MINIVDERSAKELGKLLDTLSYATVFEQILGSGSLYMKVHRLGNRTYNTNSIRVICLNTGSSIEINKEKYVYPVDITLVINRESEC